jgi:hypothetical protein
VPRDQDAALRVGGRRARNGSWPSHCVIRYFRQNGTGWNSSCKAPPSMLLSRLTLLAIPASLLLACAHTPAPQAPPPALTEDPGYITIVPDVSLSKTAQEAELKQAAVDPNADVMAEILAIPPGR